MWFTATSFEYANNATSLAVTRKYLKAEPASEVTHCSSVAQPDFDLIMFTHCNLAVLIVVLTLHDKVHTGEIIGGHEAVAHSRPYMVLLEMHRPGGQKAHCDGFLVSEHFVVTAAHCNATSYRVFLGLHNYNNQNEVQHVNVPGENAFPQKGYDEAEFKNDIMLLKLSTKAVLNKNVKPIPLADRDDRSLPKSCIVSGWGRTENSNHQSPKLLEVNVTLVENEMCVKKNKYCSKDKGGPGQGDSGGPLVCEDGKAYGVVSASKRNPDRSTIYSYTKIPDNRDWIDCIMKHN
ncbi:granzyme B [Oreochromis niloticus]|uniref:trypsin n=1 Tax=Oreochromis niloticus TaxID=8128 RepID=I3J2G4_ORENI|nr:granzyme B [Oreochromis niloticus]